MRTRPERFGFVLILILTAGPSGGTVRATVATAAHKWSGPRTATKLSQLPAGLAEAVERALGPAEGSDPGQFEQQQERQAPDGSPGDQFGYSVALNGTGHIALVGAPGKDSATGAGYVFMENQ